MDRIAGWFSWGLTGGCLDDTGLNCESLIISIFFGIIIEFSDCISDILMILCNDDRT